MRQIIGPFTTTKSDVMNTNYLQNITFQFIATAITSGNGVLTLLGSNDGINFTAISFIDPTPANTNAQNTTRVTSLTLSSNGSKVGSVDETSKFEFLKWTITVTTDGSYSVDIHSNKVSS